MDIHGGDVVNGSKGQILLGRVLGDGGLLSVSTLRYSDNYVVTGVLDAVNDIDIVKVKVILLH